MTDDNSNLVDMDNLEEFEEALFNEDSEKVVVDTGDDAAETDEDTDAPEGDDEEVEEDSEEENDDDDNDDESEPQQKKGKPRKSLQARIDELTRRAYEAERREIDALRRLEEREAREREVAKEKPIQQRLPQGAPNPDAVDENGNLIYPLGEFDPKFVSDLTRFTVDTEIANKQREAHARQMEATIHAAQQQLREDWAQKLEAAEEENPNIREDIGELVTTFAGIDPAYGEYLAMTIMTRENGPQILEYLSHNIGEAQKIVASGPATATLEIGRLDAQLARQEIKRNARTVSHAPVPPETVNRGRKSQRNIRPDTDDLKSFEKLFYD